jgi:aconitase A
MLALTFVNPSDYDFIQSGDSISICGLQTSSTHQFAQGKRLRIEVIKRNSQEVHTFEVGHSFNEEQIKWFQAVRILLNYPKRWFHSMTVIEISRKSLLRC